MDGNGEIRIEKDVPPPGRRPAYPLDEMEIGDSFLVQADSGKLRNAATFAGRKLHRRFTVRKQPDGRFRVWRIA